MAKTDLKDIANAMGVDEKPKGSLSIDSTQYDGVKNFSVGQKVEFMVEGTVTSVSKGYTGKGTVHASIDIDDIESEDEEKAETPAEESAE